MLILNYVHCLWVCIYCLNNIIYHSEVIRSLDVWKRNCTPDVHVPYTLENQMWYNYYTDTWDTFGPCFIIYLYHQKRPHGRPSCISIFASNALKCKSVYLQKCMYKLEYIPVVAVESAIRGYQLLLVAHRH